MNTMKERFAYARTLRGYTQMALADAIGVTRGVISNIEYGKTDPPPIVVNAICRTLDINREWFLTGIGPMEPEMVKSPTLEELHAILERLPESLRLILLDTARSMEKNLTVEKTQSQTRPVDDIISDIKARQKSNSGPGRGW